MAERVVITGLGTVSGAGAGGHQVLARTLASGRSAIAPVRAFEVPGGPSRLAAEVAEAVLDALVDREAARRLSRICRLTVAATVLAVADARLEAAAVPGGGLGLVVGTEFGDFRSSEQFFAGFLRRGAGGLSPMTFPNTVMNCMGAVAAIAVGARGPTVTVNQATVAGDLAVARGAALVAGGHVAAVLAGGVDELCGPVYRRLAELRMISPTQGGGVEGCRPFAPDHNGPVVGEGATFLVLESLDVARRRGATIHAEILAAAWSSIPVAPHAAPRARRDAGSPVRRVLDQLELDGREIGRRYGSGNGDPGLDDWEEALLARDLPGDANGARPPRSLAPLFGQHGGLGALRVGAAAVEVAGGGGRALVHGIARGGCRTALVIGSAA